MMLLIVGGTPGLALHTLLCAFFCVRWWDIHYPWRAVVLITIITREHLDEQCIHLFFDTAHKACKLCLSQVNSRMNG